MGGSHNLFLRLSNSPEWLTDLKEALYLLLTIYYKEYNSETAN